MAMSKFWIKITQDTSPMQEDVVETLWISKLYQDKVFISS